MSSRNLFDEMLPAIEQRFKCGGAPAEDQPEAARLAAQKTLRKKTESRKAKPAQVLQQKLERKPNSNQLVCRYCGSDDLAPSFIERRDRRCRQCFSQRYGSAARARNAKSIS